MIIQQKIVLPNGEVETVEVEVANNYFDAPPTTSQLTIEERTTALEATQSDVIDILASALGVTI